MKECAGRRGEQELCKMHVNCSEDVLEKSMRARGFERECCKDAQCEEPSSCRSADEMSQKTTEIERGGEGDRGQAYMVQCWPAPPSPHPMVWCWYNVPQLPAFWYVTVTLWQQELHL